jgi:hypothetical protein
MHLEKTSMHVQGMQHVCLWKLRNHTFGMCKMAWVYQQNPPIIMLYILPFASLQIMCDVKCA